ncbi:GNAT family N-acetyltransferase [Streptomyces sp. NPDC059070]|uniref:GNAT family N-acetyltransferase n=1 Tax=unclassified Streptomyces TaxID=2593676 RepID=UPI0034E2F9AB
MESLVTPRLVLHPMDVRGAKSLASGTPAEGVLWAAGYPAEADLGVARRYLETCERAGDPQPFGPYEIRRREDGRIIGGLGFHGEPDQEGAVTIGYGLVPAAQGRGYATEALRALLRFARAQGITRVNGDADHQNIASQRVMTAAGMLPVGEDERVKYFAVEWPDAEAEEEGKPDGE